jgi:hypothetical protein
LLEPLTLFSIYAYCIVLSIVPGNWVFVARIPWLFFRFFQILLAVL